MFARLLAASAFALTFCLTGGAVGEPSPARPRAQAAPLPAAPQRAGPSVAEVEAALGEVGAWTLEYNAILAECAAVLNEIDAYIAIFERVVNREIREREALRQLEAWRANVVARAEALRASAVALRAPPSLAVMGELGARFDVALAAARADLPSFVDQMAAALEAHAALGAEAIRSPTKISEARQRAVFSSSLQLIRIDARRLAANLAAVPDGHPQAALLNAMLAYYAGFEAFPTHELRLLDSVTIDPMSVAVALRRAAQDMRGHLTEATARTERAERELRSLNLPPEARQLRQAAAQVLQSYPETVRAYGQLADTLDSAAGQIEAGTTVDEAWASHEQASLPILDEIARLDDQRTQLVAGLRR